jgi:tRNA G18 (ribose-2'-O)-methylase SpoU
VPAPNPQDVTDPGDPRLADYRDLTDAASRRAVEVDGGDGCIIVEGVLALERVLAGGPALRSVLVTPPRRVSLAPLLARVPPSVPILVAERAVLRDVTGFDVHRGVLASAERRPPPSADDVLGAARRIVVTEGLNDHENLGSLFRNAAATGLDAVLLDDRSADPWYRRSVRVSLGWAAVLPHARLGPLPAGYDALRTHGFRVVALTPAPHAVAVDRAADDGLLDDPVALVVGAEGPGLGDGAVSGADLAVRVPMPDGVDSFNVATALAVVASFAAARRGWT